MAPEGIYQHSTEVARMLICVMINTCHRINTAYSEKELPSEPPVV